MNRTDANASEFDVNRLIVYIKFRIEFSFSLSFKFVGWALLIFHYPHNQGCRKKKKHTQSTLNDTVVLDLDRTHFYKEWSTQAVH